MPGVSSHFDLTTGRHVSGQQVLTLGLSCAQGFVPTEKTKDAAEDKRRIHLSSQLIANLRGRRLINKVQNSRLYRVSHHGVCTI